jgi:type I restriction enzyme R subunit
VNGRPRGHGRAAAEEQHRFFEGDYDVLAYIAYAAAPIIREERVAARRQTIVARYDERLQAFLDFVLLQYVEEGVGELDDAKLPHLLELKYRSLHDAAAHLGSIAGIRDAFVGFQAGLYR